ncbi:MAG: hypothetical protein K9G62_05995 [Alphaproteobacteria bacterium]|nr:hypothetical protein [Alphaproteobacteria bacterium]
MIEDKKETGRQYAEFLASLPESERNKISQENIRDTEQEHQDFRTSFRARHCYLCQKSISSFYPELPCLHWLLRPSGFKKNDFLAIVEKYGFFQMQSYLRWVANEGSFARNINDLKDEGTGKLFEVTIKYKKLEWSFSCSENDYSGHEKSEHFKHPHYHFQMRIDSQPFINYNDFHLPFRDYEIITIEAIKTAPHIVKGRFTFGEGIGDVLTQDTVETIVTSSLSTKTTNDAAFKIDTLIMADEGQTISGEDVYQIFEKAKKNGVTVASLAHEIPNASARVVVSPGPGVVGQALRSGRRKKDNKQC